SHSPSRMNNLTHGHFSDRIWDYFVSVVVYHRTNVPPAPINRAMNWALTVHRAPPLIDWITIQIKFHNIIQADKFGAAGARHEEPIRTPGVPHANMPESIDHAFRRQDSITIHQFLKLIIYFCGHASPVTLKKKAWTNNSRLPEIRYETQPAGEVLWN